MPVASGLGAEPLSAAFAEVAEKWSMLLFMVLHLLDVHQTDRYGNTILHYAATTKQVDKLKLVASKVDEQDRGIINYFNNFGQHCLHIAVTYSTKEVVKALIEWGQIDVNIRNIKTGDTPLHVAVSNNNQSVLEYLLDEHHAVDTTIRNLNGQTAYDMAVETGQTDASFLLATQIMRIIE